MQVQPSSSKKIQPSLSRESQKELKDREELKNTFFSHAAFLPDIVLRMIEEEGLSTIPRSIECTVVMLVLEFPALPEATSAYALSDDLTVDDLVDELSKYFGEIVSYIVAHEGDVFQFAGNLLQCIWQVEEENDAATVVTQALETALVIQKKCDDWMMGIGKALRILIGISFGNCRILFVGEKDMIFYVATGPVVTKAISAKDRCVPGQIMLSPEAWYQISSRAEKYIWQALSADYAQVYKKTPFQENAIDVQSILKERRDMLLRYEVSYPEEIKRFLHSKVKDLTTDQQCSFLPSLSQVTMIVVFLENPCMETLHVLHQAVTVVQKYSREYEGLFTKLLYDELSRACVLFGIPGYKHQNDPARGLMCARDVVINLNDLNISATARVVTNMTLCGVLGLKEKRFYTVTFRKDLAYQLYTGYKVVCCSNTYFRSRREFGDIFKSLPRQIIKGHKYTALFYHFNFSQSPAKREVKIIARENERSCIMNSLAHLRDHSREVENFPLIVIKGKLGIGRSHLLRWVLQEASEIGFSLQCFLTKYSSNETFYTGRQIVKDVLAKKCIDNEIKLLEVLGEEAQQYPLYMLNKWLGTKFNNEHAISNNDKEDMKNMMEFLLRKCSDGNPILIALDDIENMEKNSWFFLQDILLTGIACILAVVSDSYEPPNSSIDNILQQCYKEIVLDPYRDEDIPSLACYFLNVHVIHKGFLSFLTKNSDGNASLLEEILMLHQVQEHFCIVPYQSITKTTLDAGFVSAENISVSEENMKVCDVLDEEGLSTLIVPRNLLDVAKKHTNGLKSIEMMMARKCSCFNHSVGFYILQAVYPELTTLEFCGCLSQLVKKNILAFGCNHLDISGETSENVERFPNVIQLVEIPKEFCIHPLVFYSHLIRESAEISLSQRKRAKLCDSMAACLEKAELKCDSCLDEMENQRPSAYELISCNLSIPRCDLRLCQCLKLAKSLYIEIEWLNRYGSPDLRRRIKWLLKAAETALVAEKEEEAEELISKSKELIDKFGKHFEDHLNLSLIYVSIDRLTAEVKLLTGNENDALRYIKKAFQKLGIIFPSDYERYRVEKKKGFQLRESEEEERCLGVGSFILYCLEEFDTAYIISKYRLKTLLKLDSGFKQVLRTKCSLLLNGCKTKKTKDRTSKWVKEILEDCDKRLKSPAVLSILELRDVMTTYIDVVSVLFERNNLTKAAHVGGKALQIFQEVNGSTYLARIIPLLALTYYYQDKLPKAIELIGEMQDAFQQSGDILSVAVYYAIVVKILRAMDNPELRDENIEMCTEFALSWYNKPLDTQNKSLQFYVAAKMALWSIEHDLEDAFRKWHQRALNFRRATISKNYWCMAAEFSLLLIDVNYARRQVHFPSYVPLRGTKEDIHRDMKELSKNAETYVPVLSSEITRLQSTISNIWYECHKDISKPGKAPKKKISQMFHF